MSKPLPPGWVLTQLEHIIAPKGLFSDGDWVESKDQDPAGHIRLIQLADIGDGKFLNKSARFINETAFERLNCTEILPGDVLIARMPDPLGRACVFPTLAQKCITVVDVAIVRPANDMIDTRWLAHFINSPIIREKMKLLASGTTRQRISRKNLAGIDFPLPPTNEQKRIADKLDAVFMRLYACRAKLQQLRPGLISLRQSLLQAAMDGSLTNSWRETNNVSSSPTTILQSLEHYKHELAKTKTIKSDLLFSPPACPNDAPQLPQGWSYVNLASLATKITDGEHSTPARTTEGFYLLSARNVTNDGIILDDVDYVGKAEFEKLRKRCDPQIGDVLVSCSGSVGRVALVDRDDQYVMVRSAAMIRPARQYVDSAFLMISLQSPFCQTQIQERSKATAQANLFLGEIKQIVIPLPSMDEQLEIVRRITALVAHISTIEDQITQTELNVDQFVPSLLAKAFAGELVSQDATDEPASELLRRIRQEKSASNHQPKSRKPRQPKESKSVRKLVEVLAEAGDWILADEAFRRCGVGDGSQTEQIEELYAELRTLDKAGRLAVNPVTDSQGRKQHDQLKLLV